MPAGLIIFDLDGTLVDSSADITCAINHAISPCGIAPLSVEQAVGLIGEGLTRLVEKVLGPDRTGLHAGVMARFVEHYGAHLTDHTRPYPGVAETLELLAGFKKAVVSNKREQFSIRLLEDLGLLRHFDLVVGSDSVPERKPSPQPLLHVMHALGFAPAESVMVGDSPYDIQAGKASGSLTVAVTYGYRDRSLLTDADILIDEFRDLVKVLRV